MFANALNRMIVWCWNTLAEERSFLRAGGGPGCPPISNEQQLKRDLRAVQIHDAIGDRVLVSDTALVAMVESLKRESVNTAPCAIPPSLWQAGWRCSRKAGHDGPCAMHPPGTKDCPKCGGAGWCWGHQLDNPSEDTYADSITRYTCDGEKCVERGDA